MKHDHPDEERLTFGCAGCVERAELARWANAPVRRCTFHCTYDVFNVESGRPLTFTLDVRVPEGVDGWTVDTQYADFVGEKFVMSLPDDVPMNETSWAMETMEVERVDIGPVVRTVTPMVAQLDLFGATA